LISISSIGTRGFPVQEIGFLARAYGVAVVAKYGVASEVHAIVFEGFLL